MMNYSNGGDQILAADSIKSIADFKNKEVLVKKGTVYELLLLQALDKNGLNASDVKILDTPGDVAGVAFGSGKADIVVTGNPGAGKALQARKSGRIIFSSAEEKIPLAGIARVMKLSEDWLQRYANRCYQSVPHRVQVQPKATGSLAVQMDELWSFVDEKGNKQWVWLALDRATREIVGCHIGDRSSESARKRWQSMPGVYRQCAVIYTDDWEAYAAVLPSKRHPAVGKLTSCTSTSSLRFQLSEVDKVHRNTK